VGIRAKAGVRMSIEEIEQNLPSFLQHVEAGDVLTILKAGKPLAEVKPATAPSRALRPYGLCAGQFTVPDDFDAPLPEEMGFPGS